MNVRPARSIADRKTLASSAVTDGQVDGLELGLHSPGLDAREVQQRVDQLGQPQTVAVDELQLSARLLVDAGRPGAQLVDRSEDQREGGAEFVADVGEERGLGPVEFGQLLGTLLLGPVAACAAHPRSDVPGHQLDEAAVAVVEAPVPVQRGYQKPDRRAALLYQRHHQRLRRRLVPGARRQIQGAERRVRSVRVHRVNAFATGHTATPALGSISGAAGCPGAIPLTPARRASPSSPNR